MDLRIGRIHIEQIYGAVFALHIAVNGRVVAHAHIIAAHRRGAVERGTLEVDIGIFHVAVRVARGGRRRVIHPVSVNIKTGGKILRNEKLRHDDLRVCILARGEICLGNAHQRALYGFAVGVVRAVIFHAVDKINIIARFHDKPAVGIDLRRSRVGRCERVGRIIFAARGEHSERNDERQNRYNQFFAFFQHKTHKLLSALFQTARTALLRAPLLRPLRLRYFFIIH